jgi:hypothetical protein
VFLSRSPLKSPKAPAFDLHALGTPPALILSQDQTRQKMVKLLESKFTEDAVPGVVAGAAQDAHVSW